MSTCTQPGRPQPLSRLLARVALGALPSLVAALTAQAVQAQAPPGLLRPPTLTLQTDKPTTVGDVNGDGHADLVAYQNQFFPVALHVFLGNGLGGFSSPVVTSVTPAEPRELSAGDFNGDGRTDIAFLVNLTTTVEVVFGAANGALVDPVVLTLPEPGVGQHLTVCDATGDGQLDLVVSQSGTNRLALFAGTGDGGFISPAAQITAVMSTLYLGSGDFDGDGAIDLFVNNGLAQNSQIGVLFGRGGGQFEPPEFIVGVQPMSPLTADLDGDGRDDIALVHNAVTGDSEYWSWKPGTGFSPSLIDLGASILIPTPATAGDLDRDGIADLVLGFDSPAAVENLKLQGDGSLEIVGRRGVAAKPVGLHVVDLDEDGGPDLVASALVATLLAGQGDGDLQGEHVFSSATLRDMAVADATNDGFPDVVAVFGAGHPAELLRGRLDGGLEPPQSIDVGPQADQLWLVDATGDGLTDVLVTGGTAIAVAPGRADGGFDPPRLSPVSQTIVRAQLAPFGGDALPDLAVMLHDPPMGLSQHVHFLIDSAGTFTDSGATTVTPPGGESQEFVAADLDGDGDTDLIVKWYGTGNARAFINRPTGFEPELLLDSIGTLLGAEDYDGDGHADLASNTSPGFAIRSHYTPTGFVSTTELPVASGGVDDLVAADMDGDGVRDLVATRGMGPNPLVVLLGNGTGGFEPLTGWETGGVATHAGVGDLDGDGALDVVVTLLFGQLETVENGLGPWTKLGHSLAGAAGWSRLQGFGLLTTGSPVTLRVSNGLPGAFAILIAGPTAINAPFKGGVLVPQPTLIIPIAPLDGDGALQVAGTWPAMPSGASFVMQVWRPEPAAPTGFGATTAIRGTAP